MSDMRLACRYCPKETTQSFSDKLKHIGHTSLRLLIGELHDRWLQSITFARLAEC